MTMRTRSETHSSRRNIHESSRRNSASNIASNPMPLRKKPLHFVKLDKNYRYYYYYLPQPPVNAFPRLSLVNLLEHHNCVYDDVVCNEAGKRCPNESTAHTTRY
jgi:hypothetical protein